MLPLIGGIAVTARASLRELMNTFGDAVVMKVIFPNWGPWNTVLKDANR